MRLGKTKLSPEEMKTVANDRYERLMTFTGLKPETAAELRKFAGFLTLEVFDPDEKLDAANGVDLTPEMIFYRQALVDELVKLLTKAR